MKASVAILLAAIAACAPAESVTAGRHKEATVRVRALAHEVSPADDDGDPPHEFPLPDDFGYSMTPGEEPTPAHAAGTVYMLAGPAGAPSLTIAQWDLATGKAVHRAVLPNAPDDGPTLAYEGGVLHVVSSGPDGRRWYIRFSSELRVLSRVSLGDVGRPNTIASDGTLTVITSCRWFFDAAGPCFAVTYDERGIRIASRSLDGDLQEFGVMRDDAAVVEGHVYLLRLRDGTDGGNPLHVDELAPDLTPIARSVVPAQEEHWFRDSTLSAHGDRLVVDAPPAQYELSLDLADVKDVPRVAPPTPRFMGHAWCPEHVRVGPVDVLACRRSSHSAEMFVAWGMTGSAHPTRLDQTAEAR
jgi:hypothetical protein